MTNPQCNGATTHLRRPAAPRSSPHAGHLTAPPEPFIAHPYTLLQTHQLVGRERELGLLTDWVAGPDAAGGRARVLNVVAAGGMGKSALTWKWFNDIAPREMGPPAGRMWWSFYEPGATFESLIASALAYVTQEPPDAVQKIPAPERETRLLDALNREPLLLVLDGLERVMLAYSRPGSSPTAGDDPDRQATDVPDLPGGATQSFAERHRLRKLIDPRASSFLRKLSRARAARVLISSRLYPADLQTVTGEPLPGCGTLLMPGLTDEDALELWQAFGAAGTPETLLPIFNRADNHPLLIQVLAGEVARYRRAPATSTRGGATTRTSTPSASRSSR